MKNYLLKSWYRNNVLKKIYYKNISKDNGNKKVVSDRSTSCNTLYALRALTGAPGFASARSVGRYAPSFPRLRSPTLRVAILATRNVAYNKTLCAIKSEKLLKSIISKEYIPILEDLLGLY
jgi:hypothetical protein